MSRQLELLARLSPAAANLTGSAGGDHRTSLQPADIAAALGNVGTPMGSKLLRAEYAGDGLHELARQWRARVLTVAKEQGWQIHRKDRAEGVCERLADATLAEHMNCICPRCNGLGFKKKSLAHMVRGMRIAKRLNPALESNPIKGVIEGDHLILQCERCAGVGKSPLTLAERATRLGFEPTHSTYRVTWNKRFEMLLLELSRIEVAATEEFGRQLKNR